MRGRQRNIRRVQILFALFILAGVGIGTWAILDTRRDVRERHDEVLVTLEGEPVELTSFEYRLLEYLMLHAGEVCSKTQITEALYDQDFERDSNVIEVFIGRLRRKLDPGSEFKPIETLRGRGYRIVLPRGAPESD